MRPGGLGPSSSCPHFFSLSFYPLPLSPFPQSALYVPLWPFLFSLSSLRLLSRALSFTTLCDVLSPFTLWPPLATSFFKAC